MTKQELLNKIKDIELKIFIYSDRDRIRTKQLEIELKELNMTYLDKIVPTLKKVR